MKLPLCQSWPNDKRAWHFMKDGEYSVKSGHHYCHSLKYSDATGSSNTDSSRLWKSLWKLRLPPCIKVFGRRLCKNALPTCGNLGKRIEAINIGCSICSADVESSAHCIFKCPPAVAIWEASGIDNSLWDLDTERTDCILHNALQNLSNEDSSMFLALAWECWNVRNGIIFGKPRKPRSLSISSTRSLIQDFTNLTSSTSPPPPPINPFGNRHL